MYGNSSACVRKRGERGGLALGAELRKMRMQMLFVAAPAIFDREGGRFATCGWSLGRLQYSSMLNVTT